MNCCIGLGQVDKKLYILLLAVLFRMATTFIYGINSLEFYEERSISISQTTLKEQIQLQSIMRFFGITVLSFLCYIYKNQILLNNNDNNLEDNRERSSNLHSKKEKKKFLLIYNGFPIDSNEHIEKILFTAFLLVFMELAEQFYNIFGPPDSDYWTFEILFTAFFIKRIFKIRLYSHQKYSIGFIIIFCSLLKLLTSLRSNEDKIGLQLFYIPLFSLLILFIKSYTYTKIKWLMDIKYISISKILLMYGLFGFFISLVIYILSIIYFHSFGEKFGNDKFQTAPINWGIYILEVILVIAYMCFNFVSKFYYMYTLKTFSPIHVLINNSLYYLFLQIVLFFKLIYEIINKIGDNDLLIFFYYVLINIFSVCCYMIYVELIELKFCGCDYDLKKNIIRRGRDDSISIVGLNEEIDRPVGELQREGVLEYTDQISNSSRSSA